jgi:hypothetical protein
MFGVIKVAHGLDYSLRVVLTFSEGALCYSRHLFIWLAVLPLLFYVSTGRSFIVFALKEVIV